MADRHGSPHAEEKDIADTGLVPRDEASPGGVKQRLLGPAKTPRIWRRLLAFAPAELPINSPDEA
ncbi:hypothetical protein GCM10007148_23100 [Parvularcula lutaonensis]|nr:hypothetical protein GCM10007148_23100 [Parvularcula lutaonensis]